MGAHVLSPADARDALHAPRPHLYIGRRLSVHIPRLVLHHLVLLCLFCALDGRAAGPGGYERRRDALHCLLPAHRHPALRGRHVASGRLAARQVRARRPLFGAAPIQAKAPAVEEVQAAAGGPRRRDQGRVRQSGGVRSQGRGGGSRGGRGGRSGGVGGLGVRRVHFSQPPRPAELRDVRHLPGRVAAGSRAGTACPRGARWRQRRAEAGKARSRTQRPRGSAAATAADAEAFPSVSERATLRVRALLWSVTPLSLCECRVLSSNVLRLYVRLRERHYGSTRAGRGRTRTVVRRDAFLSVGDCGD
mmetsp:Transcript_23346/g.78811  ORF Transcript_23346/g.78811 Transcript_23346/m.78811 type:complete len:305 (-) Transcript_23346:26-940(-)